MKARDIKNILLVIAILIPFLMLALISNFNKNPEGKMEAQNLRKKGVFNEVRTICFGRFLVDVPVHSTISYGPASVESDIFFLKNGSKDLEKIVSTRLAEIGKEIGYLPKYEIADLPLVGTIIEGVVNGQKILFGAVNSVGYVIDSFVPIGNDIFVQKFGPVPAEKDYLPRINSIASRIRPRNEHEIPEGIGICIEGGFVEIEPVRERVTIGVRFNEFPDVRLSIDAHKNQGRLPLGSSPNKLRGEARSDAEALGLGNFFARIKVFRNGRRQIGPWDGEELVTRRPAYKEDTDAHEFRFHSMGATNDALHPELDIRFDSGVLGNHKAKVKPSVTDEEAMELWDTIISTIRVRQASDATTIKQLVSKTTLGSVIRSGNLCSQSGLWECIEKRKIKEEQRRWFKEGERIPLVLVKSGGGLWKTLLGDKHNFTAVDWKLLEYEAGISESSLESAEDALRHEVKIRKDTDA